MKYVSLLALAVTGGLASQAQAQFVGYDNRALWLGAAGTPSLTEDFESFTLDTDYKDPAALSIALGTLTVPSPRSSFRNIIDVAPFLYTDNTGTTHASAFTNKDEPTEVVITLLAPATAFGCELSGAAGGEGLEIAAYAAGVQLGVVPSTTNAMGAFLGFTSSTPFDRVVFRSINLNTGSGGEGFGLDNLELVGGSPCAALAYCTTSTTTNGCNPSISGAGTPSVGAASGFTMTVANVEGQKSGLIFYGIDNTGFTPLAWGAGSTSLLCVKPPTQRTSTQSSGGTIGQCDGALSIDFLAFVAANPGCLGAPFAAGDVVYAQGWFRDPAAVKTTNLTDALRVTMCP